MPLSPGAQSRLPLFCWSPGYASLTCILRSVWQGPQAYLFRPLGLLRRQEKRDLVSMLTAPAPTLRSVSKPSLHLPLNLNPVLLCSEPFTPIPEIPQEPSTLLNKDTPSVREMCSGQPLAPCPSACIPVLSPVLSW